MIWASTTPVPYNQTPGLGRTYQGAVDYNAQALKSLSAVAGRSLVVTDLWAAVIASCGVDYTSCPLQLPNNVHFEPAGQQYLAQKVAAGILAVLGL